MALQQAGEQAPLPAHLSGIPCHPVPAPACSSAPDLRGRRQCPGCPGFPFDQPMSYGLGHAHNPFRTCLCLKIRSVIYSIGSWRFLEHLWYKWCSILSVLLYNTYILLPCSLVPFMEAPELLGLCFGMLHLQSLLLLQITLEIPYFISYSMPQNIVYTLFWKTKWQEKRFVQLWAGTEDRAGTRTELGTSLIFSRLILLFLLTLWNGKRDIRSN